jgi:hypothetical protein
MSGVEVVEAGKVPGVAILPFDPDPRLLAMLLPFFSIAAALVIAQALRKLVDRYFAEDDPRRFYIAQTVLYVGLFAVVAVAVLAGR